MPPKTASTSLTDALKKTNLTFSFPNQITSPMSHLKLDEIIKIYDISDLEEYKVFQIVRNPYHRFVSSYFQLMRIVEKLGNIKFKNYDLNEFTNHLYDSKKSENFISSFYGDISFVESSIKNNIGWGGTRLFDTQLSWKNLECNVTYFKLEEICYDISPISNYLGLPINDLNTLNSSGNKKYLDLINEEMKLIIDELFYDDFKSFQYLIL